MLLVKVINLPVFYDGKRYEVGEELTIKKANDNSSVFETVEELEAESEREKELKKLTIPKLQELLTEEAYTDKTSKAELIRLIIAAEEESED